MQNETAGIARQMANAPRKNKHDQTAPVQTAPSTTVADELNLDVTGADADNLPEPTAPVVVAVPRRSVAAALESLFPAERITFKMNVKEAGKPWSDGTTQQTVADALIPMVDPLSGHNTGLFIKGARIVKRTKGTTVSVDLQLPSTGTAFRTPMIDTDDEKTKNGLALWRKTVADSFKTWRLKEKAAGAANATGIVQASAIPLTADDLNDLGI